MIVLNKYNSNNLSLIMKKYSVTSPNKLMKIDKKGDRINKLKINTEKYNALNFLNKILLTMFLTSTHFQALFCMPYFAI